MAEAKQADESRAREVVDKLAKSTEGGQAPRRVLLTGGSGPARVRRHVKSRYSAGEWLKAPVSNES